jgi:SAM-dependent methyltransferase
MHPFAHRHETSTADAATPTTGSVLNMGWSYDLIAWLLDATVFRGTLRSFRDRALELAELRSGEAVLDVGCGTGVLAQLAKSRVGAEGRVVGLDPGPRQITRARSQALRHGLDIDFRIGAIEALALPDRSFDVVLSTLMMHHLPDDLKRQGLAAIARVLRPGGRLVIVDFKRSEAKGRKAARLGVGGIGIQDQRALVEEAGFIDVATGGLPMPRIPHLAGAGWLFATRSGDGQVKSN